MDFLRGASLAVFLHMTPPNIQAERFADINKYMKNFLLDIFAQILGIKRTPTRGGKVSLSRNAFNKMRENKLDFEALEHVFKNGREVKMLVEDFTIFSIGITYKYDYRKGEFVITSCWKREHAW